MSVPRSTRNAVTPCLSVIIAAQQRSGLDRHVQAIRLCKSGNIERTWWVSGRGGKLHSFDEGSVNRLCNSRQVSPASSDRKIALGSLPAYATPEFATANDVTFPARKPSSRAQA